MGTLITFLLPMNFSSRLLQARKNNGLTQKDLADASQVNITQIRRYERGLAQPTLERLIKIAQTLHVSLDHLVFDEDERGPSDRTKLLFEAIGQLKENEQLVIQELLEGMISKYESNRWSNAH